MIRLILILVLYVGVTVMFYIHHAIKGAVLGYFVQNFGVITIFTWITVLLAYMELGGKQKRNSEISSNHFHRPSNEIEMTFLNSTRPLVSPEPPKSTPCLKHLFGPRPLKYPCPPKPLCHYFHAVSYVKYLKFKLVQ